MFNVLNMGIAWTFLYIVFGPYLYPGVNMAETVLLALPLVFIISLTFMFFAVAMPRSGGDYVWVSRSIHPAISFMENFLLVAIMLSFLGPVGGWLLNPGISGIMTSWGMLTHNSALLTQASSVVTQTNTFIAALVVSLVAIGMNFAGTRNVWRFQWVTFILVIIGVVAFIAAMFATGHDAFVSNFNANSGMNYNSIVSAATSAGYNTGFLTSALFLGSVYAFLNFYGFQWSAYVGGEVKNVGRSQVLAILGSVLLFGALAYLSYAASYAVAGAPFVHAAAYLSQAGNAAWTAAMLPYSNYMINFATSSPWVATLVSLAIIGSVFGSVTTVVIMAARCLFAWSFDRIIPSAFSSVDQRFHVPRNAFILVLVIAILYITLSVYTTVLTLLSYAILGMWVSTAIIGIAAAVFPYRRKDIFEKAPSLVQRKIGGLPLMTLFGAITAVVGVFVALSSVVPEYTGAAVNSYYVVAIVVTMVVGLAIYGFAYWHNRRVGIDMGVGFREIPPA